LEPLLPEAGRTTFGPPTENILGDNLALTDTDFYFAWVDFEAGKTIGLTGMPGDFDNDGDVDGTDLGIWEQSYAMDPDGDADADGDTDGNDFLIWQQKVTGVSAVGAVASIPEPDAALLMLFGATASAAARKWVG
jgi:hypothetical protein